MLRKRAKPYRPQKSNQHNGDLKKKRLEIIGSILFLIGAILNFAVRYLDMHKPPPQPVVSYPQPQAPIQPQENINAASQTNTAPRVGRRRKPAPPQNRNQNGNRAERATGSQPPKQ